jgi:hypothetical protein
MMFPGQRGWIEVQAKMVARSGKGVVTYVDYPGLFCHRDYAVAQRVLKRKWRT